MKDFIIGAIVTLVLFSFLWFAFVTGADRVIEFEDQQRMKMEQYHAQ